MEHQDVLEQLYHATEEDLLYAVGLLAGADQNPAPLIQVHYGDWSREQLAVIRAAFTDGISLLQERQTGQDHSFHLATQQAVTIQVADGEETSILRAPAWDAHLVNVDGSAAAQFAVERQRLGGFLLLIQARESEFLAAVDDSTEQVHLGPIRPLSLPPPPCAM